MPSGSGRRVKKKTFSPAHSVALRGVTWSTFFATASMSGHVSDPVSSYDARARPSTSNTVSTVTGHNGRPGQKSCEPIAYNPAAAGIATKGTTSRKYHENVGWAFAISAPISTAIHAHK